MPALASDRTRLRRSLRFKFTLRFLAVAIFLFADTFGLLGWQMHRHLRRVAAVK